MKKVSRVIALILSLAFVVSLFVGCGGKPVATETKADAKATAAEEKKPDPKPAEKIKIRVASTMTGADAFTPVWQAALKDYQDKNPNVEIVDEATGAAGEAFKTKIDTDVAAGNEPDVAYAFNGAAATPMFQSGKFIDWEEALKADTAWGSNFSKDAVEAARKLADSAGAKGKLISLPWIGYYEGMFVNKDLFEKNGLQVPKTYEDILKAVDVFKAKKITPIAASFNEEPHYLIELFVLSTGGREGQTTDYDPSWAKGLSYIKELYNKGAFTPDCFTIKQETCADLFAAKQAAMFVSGSWSMGKVKDQDTTVVIPLPMVPGGKADPSDCVAGFGTGWYVSKDLNDKKKGEPLKFVKYMTSPEISAKFAAIGGSQAVKCKLENATLAKKSGGEMVANAKNVLTPFGDRINQESWTKIWKGLQQVLGGRTTPDALIAEAKKLDKK